MCHTSAWIARYIILIKCQSLPGHTMFPARWSFPTNDSRSLRMQCSHCDRRFLIQLLHLTLSSISTIYMPNEVTGPTVFLGSIGRPSLAAVSITRSMTAQHSFSKRQNHHYNGRPVVSCLNECPLKSIHYCSKYFLGPSRVQGSIHQHPPLPS